MSWTSESSWHSHESEGLKPDWVSPKSLFSLRNLAMESKIIFSRILLHTGKRETGLLFIICLSPFLCDGTIIDFF